ncbi:bifunctional oligoribonuclease/PAP phosphatase NrnA [Treponema sp. TIM-1]|uniref:DHH family phosphoesterase n=1 Tax=Treponema sp. TIM-1 TaxID=2898417 RepID=UPI003981135C
MYKPLPVPAELLAFIREGNKFLVAGHHEPDGDCVGSQLALTSALRRLGKEVIPCSAGPFKRSEIMPYAGLFIPKPGTKEREGARVLVLDCSGLDRTGDLQPFLEGLPTAIIDHHATNKNTQSTAENPVFLDTAAPATCFMIQAVLEALELALTPEEAELLFFGLGTDTGFFRHIDSNGAATFIAAARLVTAGASPKKVYQAINGGKSLNSRILLGRVLSRASAYFGGRLILSEETYEETQRFGLEGRDSDNLYQLLQSVAGVEAIVVIRQETPKNCTIGFRSRDRINVAEIALQFGGGGHKNAAGSNTPGVIEKIRPQVIQAFEKIFSLEP